MRYTAQAPFQERTCCCRYQFLQGFPQLQRTASAKSTPLPGCPIASDWSRQGYKGPNLQVQDNTADRLVSLSNPAVYYLPQGLIPNNILHTKFCISLCISGHILLTINRPLVIVYFQLICNFSFLKYNSRSTYKMFPILFVCVTYTHIANFEY